MDSKTDDSSLLSPGTAKKRLGSYLLKYGVPLVISVGLCWLLFHNEDINPSKMWNIIRRDCDFRWIVLNIFFGIMAQVFRAARWQIQLRALGIRPSFWQLVLSILGTYSVNLVFPRLGEVWRTGYIATHGHIGISTSSSTEFFTLVS